jgi:hypothetical protein
MTAARARHVMARPTHANAACAPLFWTRGLPRPGVLRRFVYLGCQPCRARLRSLCRFSHGATHKYLSLGYTIGREPGSQHPVDTKGDRMKADVAWFCCTSETDGYILGF